MIDIGALRDETPGCRTKTHFNNAGASLMPTPVISAMSDYLAEESVTGGYETADLHARDAAGFYQGMGRLLNAGAGNIAFTSSATSSFSRALSCIPLERGDSILIAREDYISNQIAFLSMQKRMGINLLRAESLPEGGTDPDDMRKLMDRHHPKLVSVSHVPTNSGLVQPIAEVGKLCRERDIPYLVDACQSAGQLPLDVKQVQCDFLSGTFRKFMRGPRGAGFLFVSDNILEKKLEPLFLDMRGGNWTEKDRYEMYAGARRFEEWELPYALLMGSKVAVEYALNIGLGQIQQINEYLCKLVRKRLSESGFETLDKGKHISSIITVKMPGKDPAKVLGQLRSMNINTSITDRGSAVIDFDAKGVSWALRISPHYYNTEKEIELLMQALTELK